MADLVVHFVKARGTGAKTFKLKAVDLPARGRVTLSKKIGLKQLTTRKHYPGVHRRAALLNGGPRSSVRFAARLRSQRLRRSQRAHQPRADVGREPLIERALDAAPLRRQVRDGFAEFSKTWCWNTFSQIARLCGGSECTDINAWHSASNGEPFHGGESSHQ